MTDGLGVVCLILQVNRLAQEFVEPSAGERDLEDTVAFLRSLPVKTNCDASEIKRHWLPYFEARRSNLKGSGRSSG